MHSLSRFSVSLDSALLARFDKQLEKRGCPTRSKAIADLIRESLICEQWKDGDEVAAAIILVYDHHKRELSSRLTHVQHDDHHLISCSQHVHLDHDNCLEVIVARGKAKDIHRLHQKLKATKGVKFASLAGASIGQGL
jgi:CopG family nickel-responsive transcriptional regulator